jgi:hypothetical protein
MMVPFFLMSAKTTDRKTVTPAGQGFAAPDLVLAMILVGVEGVWSGALGGCQIMRPG